MHYKDIFLLTGSISDGGVWSNTDFMQALEKGTADLSSPTPLPGSDESEPISLCLCRR